MSKKLYVGNLAHELNNNDLQQLFETHGNVVSAQIIIDRDTGKSKGFGFVEMDTATEAKEAIDALNGKEFRGRPLTVNEARPQAERGPRRDGNRSGGGFRGGHGGGRRY